MTPLTVADLIRELELHDPGARVLMDADPMAYTVVTSVAALHGDVVIR